MKTERECRYDATTNKMMKKYTIKEILQDNWDHFVQEMAHQGKKIRKTILEEVDKVINCQNPDMGFALYACPTCHVQKRVPFTCKSRFCNSCGAKYSKARALAMESVMLKCSHRHVVFTIPEELRNYFAHDRSLLNLLFTAAHNTISYYFNARNKAENYVPGSVCILHTFGRDLKWNPHIHMILCEKAIGNSNIWTSFSHINYEALRKSWQYSILKLLLEHLPSLKILVDKLYANNESGFYVFAPPIKNFNAGVINYITRYAGRPVLEQSRLIDYTGDTVTFTYTPHGSNELVTEKLSVFQFIKKLIIHIPERNFKMIRYFRFYCRHNHKHLQYLKHSKRFEPAHLARLKSTYNSWRKLIKFTFGHDPIKCIYCGDTLELVELFLQPSKNKILLLYLQ